MNRISPLAASLSILAPASFAQHIVVFDGMEVINDGLGGFTFDVDADGNDDVRFDYLGISVNGTFGWDAVVRGLNNAQVYGEIDDNGRGVLTEFQQGDVIGTSAGTLASNIPGAAAYEDFFNGLSGGPLFDQGRGFVGFTWVSGLDGGRRYGWADIELDNVDDSDSGSLILYRIGWNATSRAAVTVGVPAPAAGTLLALGGLGLAARRRR